MAARANYVKLGLFVVLAFVAAIVLAVAVGTLKLRRETSTYVTYFAESVEGLDRGAPVKARGVTIGRVGAVTFGPDREMVEVNMEFDVPTLRAMGIGTGKVPANVRAQLASQGLVGTRFILLDFFDPATHPPPPLKFDPPVRYVPSTPSVQRTLEASASKTLERLSVLADSLVEQGVVEKTAQTLTDLDGFLTHADRTLEKVDHAELPARTAKAIEDVRTTVERLNKALGRVDGEGGVLSAAQRAFSSLGEVGRNASMGTRELDHVLEELFAAATAIRELAEELQQNPDMLLKGRKKP